MVRHLLIFGVEINRVNSQIIEPDLHSQAPKTCLERKSVSTNSSCLSSECSPALRHVGANSAILNSTLCGKDAYCHKTAVQHAMCLWHPAVKLPAAQKIE